VIEALSLVLALLVAQAADSALADARRLINEGRPAGAIQRLEALKPEGDAAVQAQIALLLGVAYYQPTTMPTIPRRPSSC
jgi:hypothetical protein